MPCCLLCYFSYLWQYLSDGRRDIHTHGSVCWVDGGTLIPLAMSVGWMRWQSYMWQCLSDGCSDIHTRGNVCRMDTVTFIPVALSVRWTQWYSYPWQCLSDGLSDIPSATAWPLERKAAEDKHQLLNGCHEKYKFAWWLGLFLPLPTCCPLTPSAALSNVYPFCYIILRCFCFSSLLTLTHENSKLCMRLGDVYICLPTANKNEMIHRSLKNNWVSNRVLLSLL